LNNIKKAIYLRKHIFQTLTMSVLVKSMLKSKSNMGIKQVLQTSVNSHETIVFLSLTDTETKESLELLLLKTLANEFSIMKNNDAILSKLDISVNTAKDIIVSSKPYVFFKIQKSVISSDSKIYIVQSTT